MICYVVVLDVCYFLALPLHLLWHNCIQAPADWWCHEKLACQVKAKHVFQSMLTVVQEVFRRAKTLT